MKPVLGICTALAVLISTPTPASAHATDQAFVLLLPTGVYTTVGVLVVLVTLALTGFLPNHLGQRTIPVRRIPIPPGKVALSLLSTAVFFTLLFAGLFGSRDPTANPLPLMFWTVFWVGFVCLSGIIGSFWAWLNPWSGLISVLARLGVQPAIGLREDVADWIAFTTLILFCAFLLADPAPADPARLSFFGSAYWGGTFLAAVICGPAWLKRAELFGALLQWFGAVSAVRWQDGRLGWPGWQIVSAKGSVALLLMPLLMLGAGSFDGLNETFLWLAWLGINPLEFPGRSAVQWANTFGLVGAIALLFMLFFAAVSIGQRLAGSVSGAGLALAPTVLPIVLAYHVAHYLPGFLVEIQYVSGMLARLVGASPPVVTTGFFFDQSIVRLIWLTQGTVVVLGHMHAILLSHMVALNIYGSRRRAVVSQLPMGGFMVAYTFFGLWLLAAPKGA